tara:strand:- start:266 stop:484 length:219 start_codon:yes stop_codon:yes gene_type:complete
MKNLSSAFNEAVSWYLSNIPIVVFVGLVICFGFSLYIWTEYLDNEELDRKNFKTKVLNQLQDIEDRLKKLEK